MLLLLPLLGGNNVTVTHCLHSIEATCKKADGGHKVGYDSFLFKDYIINKNLCDTGCAVCVNQC